MTSLRDFCIVSPDVGDAAALSQLAQRLFTQTFSFKNYPPGDLAQFLDSAMSVAAYAAQIADPAYSLRVAHAGADGMIGFVKSGPNLLPLPPGEPDRARTRELHQLYITAKAQGSGLADALMQHVFDDAAAHSAAAVYLSVYAGNHRAQRFYARHGFVEIGRNPFAVGSVIDDDRVWRRRL